MIGVRRACGSEEKITSLGFRSSGELLLHNPSNYSCSDASWGMAEPLAMGVTFRGCGTKDSPSAWTEPTALPEQGTGLVFWTSSIQAEKRPRLFPLSDSKVLVRASPWVTETCPWTQLLGNQLILSWKVEKIYYYPTEWISCEIHSEMITLTGEWGLSRLSDRSLFPQWHSYLHVYCVCFCVCSKNSMRPSLWTKAWCNLHYAHIYGVEQQQIKTSA